MLTDVLAAELEAFAEMLADAARDVTFRHFRSLDISTENKASRGYDPVTIADREAERVMRDLIARRRPDDAVEGEEFGFTPGRSGFTWYLDPIDGTRAFVAGLPSWTTLIGLVADGRPLVGVIDQPWLDERYVGGPHGAFARIRGARGPIRVSRCADLREAVMATTDPYLFSPSERGAFEHLRSTARLTRYGLDAYGYARVAAGTIDIVAESGLKPHDVAALIPVIEGAGGVALDWRGERAALGRQILAAASQDLAEQALVALRRSAD
ncbi:histidinol-phosphatase [bacterium]|nr:histidinol-phosphatase [bacterium]